MKFVGLALVALLAVSAGYYVFTGISSTKSLSVKDMEVFNRWRQEHGKLYASPSEDNYRMKVLVDNHHLVEKMNADYNAALIADGRPGLRGPMFGLMSWSDMTISEFQKSHTGADLSGSENIQVAVSDSVEEVLPVSTPSLGQATYDARIRNQGSCGSCWAFSTIATIEKQYWQQSKQQLDFSQQQLVDCDGGNGGCNGGWMTTAISHIQAKGIAKSADYVYRAVKGPACLIDVTKQVPVPSIAATQLAFTIDAAIKGAAAGLSMGTGVFVGTNFYQIKAINDNYDVTVNAAAQCTSAINHAVNIIAAGRELVGGKNRAFIVLQNSWGTTWGNQGKVKIYTCSDTVIWGSNNIIIHGTSTVKL